MIEVIDGKRFRVVELSSPLDSFLVQWMNKAGVVIHQRGNRIGVMDSEKGRTELEKALASLPELSVLELHPTFSSDDPGVCS